MEPVLPDYRQACLSNVVPTVLGRGPVPPWFPPVAADADRLVLLAVDGLGWHQLQERRHLAPTLSAMAGTYISTVVPSTTATALTSLTTGLTPAAHGVMGYRLRVGPEVLNVLRWRTPGGDARERVPPADFQGLEAFLGTRPPVVTRSEFGDSGFSRAHLGGARMHGWRMPSTLVAVTRGLVEKGEPFVFAYYDGVDKVAHEFGFGDIYDAEVRAADGVVSDLLAELPSDVVVLVTSDHGQVQVGADVVELHREVAEFVTMMSGEGRFRWLHARPSQAAHLAEAARAHHGGQAWVRTRDEVLAEGWFGGDLAPVVADRLGDVVLAASEAVAFFDPADAGESRMQCRHGSLTAGEMHVPLLAATT